MGAIGVVPEIFVLIKRVGVIGNALPQPKLKVSSKKIEIIMGIKSKILPQSAVVHILINERKSGIGIIVQLLPFLIPIILPIVSQNNTPGMIGDQM
jgi:hypothetical protein